MYHKYHCAYYDANEGEYKEDIADGFIET